MEHRSQSLSKIPSRRVCALTSAHSPYDVRIFQKECQSLARAGWEVTLIAPHDRMEVADGIRILPVLRRHGRLRRFTRTAWDVYRRAMIADASVYHFHDPDLLLVGLLLRWNQRVTIYDAHEDLVSTVGGKEWIPAFARRPVRTLIKILEQSVARQMSAVITVNDDIADRLRRVNPNTVIVRNYPRLAEFPHERSPDRPANAGLVVSFGGISDQRCTGEIVSAVAHVPPDTSIKLVLAGPSDSTSLLDKVTASTGWSRTEYLGVIPRAQMLGTLRTASVSIVMFSPEPNHYNPGSNRLFEALAAGVPVIVSDFPKWRSLVEKNGVGLVANPADPSDIARAIERLLEDPAMALEMGRRGRALVRDRWCWEREERSLLALYDALGSEKSQLRS